MQVVWPVLLTAKHESVRVAAGWGVDVVEGMRDGSFKRAVTGVDGGIGIGFGGGTSQIAFGAREEVYDPHIGQPFRRDPPVPVLLS
jgi:hypothetical protein